GLPPVSDRMAYSGPLSSDRAELAPAVYATETVPMTPESIVPMGNITTADDSMALSFSRLAHYKFPISLLDLCSEDIFGQKRRHWRNGLAATVWTAAALPLPPAATSYAQTYSPPPSGDFGAAGPFSVTVDTFTNPVYPTANGETLVVSVFHP